MKRNNGVAYVATTTWQEIVAFLIVIGRKVYWAEPLAYEYDSGHTGPKPIELRKVAKHDSFLSEAYVSVADAIRVARQNNLDVQSFSSIGEAAEFLEKIGRMKTKPSRGVSYYPSFFSAGRRGIFLAEESPCLKGSRYSKKNWYRLIALAKPYIFYCSWDTLREEPFKDWGDSFNWLRQLRGRYNFFGEIHGNELKKKE